ncbi:LOW QUALITY PROTEIN: hypothetical protein RJ639_022194 [Escallonia herrerae]|uniref:Integrase catalytic domain-containing protein n=1 Tax=Escallonia herrerae TaxID=1293975 RepID=A0AA89AFR3_9ASTE|nr:LOW QUALITY PROTEIN: hypothetical protein RJ639_022194 [Escallonia herrerae]
MEVLKGGNVHNEMEKLVGKNYKYWRMCMEAYLQGQDLWELIAGTDAIPSDVPKNAESRQKWKIKCGKALFALRTYISKEFIDHVRDVCSPKEVWETLDRLFTKKNTARLQLLENELVMLKQGEIDTDEKISEARLRRYLVRGLQKEYGPFVTSIQGWSTQPSVEELENLLSNQEALAKQMAKSFENDDVLFSKGKSDKKNPFRSKNKEEDSSAEKGCSHHVTGNDILFSEVHEHHGDRVIVTADNSTHPVAKEGVVTIDVANYTSSVKLHDSYHVPGLTKNLVSVPQITDSGKYVLFGPKDVKVLDNVKEISADVIFSGEKKGSLFVMSAGEAYVKKTSQTNNAAIWHARLGHVGYQLLQQISSKKLVDGMPTLKNVREDVICQGCQYGKSHRLPFKRSSNQRSTLFELVHADLMGPTRTPSYSGHRYVMVLVDDHSRFTWVKFFKEKSEALSKFMEFKDTIGKEFGKKIKCLRSDNGLEYMLDDFFKYCDDNSILRQMTCPDTPQQNRAPHSALRLLLRGFDQIWSLIPCRRQLTRLPAFSSKFKVELQRSVNENMVTGICGCDGVASALFGAGRRVWHQICDREGRVLLAEGRDQRHGAAEGAWHFNEGGVDLVVKGPNSEQIHDIRDKKARSTSLGLITQDCTVSASLTSRLIMNYFDVHVGHFLYNDEHAKDEHFKPLLEHISKLEEALYNIQFEQHWLEAQTERQAIVNEEMGKRDVRKAFFKSVLLVGVAF